MKPRIYKGRYGWVVLAGSQRVCHRAWCDCLGWLRRWYARRTT